MTPPPTPKELEMARELMDAWSKSPCAEPLLFQRIASLLSSYGQQREDAGLERGLSNMMQAVELCKDLNGLLNKIHIPGQMLHSNSCTICRDTDKANEIMTKMQTEWEAIRSLKRGESK